MTEILQTALPDEMRAPRPLPGIAPCAPADWLRVDEAYGAQMRYRLELMAARPGAVLYEPPGSLPAGREALAEALTVLPGLGFEADGGDLWRTPDGRRVRLDWAAPLRTLGALVQEDICLLDKPAGAAEHHLIGAVLCFPANWRLAEKAGQPLTAIHTPVKEYDATLARRVQRLFDGVQPGRPLWRFNALPYGEADLHQPRRADASKPRRFLRSERQCVLRLPQTRAVVFSIHTFVLRQAAG